MGHFEIPDPMEESTTSLVSSSTSAYSSFPVDVVVYVRVQVCTHSSKSKPPKPNQALPGFVNKIQLENSHGYSFAYSIWLLSRDKGRVE